MEDKYKLYQNILETENVITVVLDKKANIVLINRKGRRVLAKEKEKLTGINWINNFIPPEERKQVKQIFYKVISGKLQGTDYYENHILTREGRKLLIAWHNSYMYDDDGKIIYAISSGDDITEKRKLENTLAKKNEELKKTIQELKKTQDQLLQKERLEAVGQLTAGVAHNFNNLLTGIIGNAEILDMDPLMREKHSREINQIIHASNRAAILIEKMLDFSKNSFLEPKDIDLPLLIREITVKIQKSLPENILLNINLKCNKCKISIDPKKLEDILTNLIFNARDSMENGGEIEITLDRVKTDGNVTCSICGEELKGNWMSLQVNDSGHGIPKNIIPHIFDPFFTTREFGKGLGLSQVFGLIEQINGHLIIEDGKKHGTAISVYFPAENKYKFVEPKNSITKAQG